MGADIYSTNTGCKIIIAVEEGLAHISISHSNRLPSYNELKKAKYELCKDIKNMAQIFPTDDEYVNLHQYTLHLWELKK